MGTLAQLGFMAACLTLLYLVAKHASEPRFGQGGEKAVGFVLLIVLAHAAAIGIMVPLSIAKHLGDGEAGIVGRLSQVVSTGALVLAAIRGWNVVMGLILLGIVGMGVLWVLGVKL